MIFSGVSWLAFSQQDPVLMRVNGKDVLRSELGIIITRMRHRLLPGMLHRKSMRSGLRTSS